MLMMQDFPLAAAGCSAGWFHTASGINTDPFINKYCFFNLPAATVQLLSTLRIPVKFLSFIRISEDAFSVTAE